MRPCYSGRDRLYQKVQAPLEGSLMGGRILFWSSHKPPLPGDVIPGIVSRDEQDNFQERPRRGSEPPVAGIHPCSLI